MDQYINHCRLDAMCAMDIGSLGENAQSSIQGWRAEQNLL